MTMENDKVAIINREKIKETLKYIRKNMKVPEDIYFYPIFINADKYKEGCECSIEVEGNNLKIEVYSVDEMEEEVIENIKKYKKIYVLIPHRIKILREGGDTFMEETETQNLRGPGQTLCKEFTSLESTDIHICHIRLNITFGELEEFIKSKLKEKDKKKEEESIEKITIVVADKTEELPKISEITKDVYLIFPDSENIFIDEIKNIAIKKKVKRVEIISHGRQGIKKLLEELGLEVEFYDVTSTISELYDRYRKLENLYKDKEEFLNVVSEIKEIFSSGISVPLVLKKVAHRLSSQCATLLITKELFLLGKETEEDIIRTLKHVKDIISSVREDIKAVNIKINDKKYLDELKDIEKELSFIEDKLTFNWEEILEKSANDLKKTVEKLKRVIGESKGKG